MFPARQRSQVSLVAVTSVVFCVWVRPAQDQRRTSGRRSGAGRAAGSMATAALVLPNGRVRRPWRRPYPLFVTWYMYQSAEPWQYINIYSCINTSDTPYTKTSKTYVHEYIQPLRMRGPAYITNTSAHLIHQYSASKVAQYRLNADLSC